MTLEYRKAAPAQRSWAAYTGDTPASWDVLVDGVVRGHIRGSCGQYSRARYFRAEFDGQRLSQVGFARLSDAKAAVVRAVAQFVVAA